MVEQRRLEEFSTPKPPEPNKKEREKPLNQTSTLKAVNGAPRALEKEEPNDLPPSYFVSASYDGKKGVASIKLYEPKTQTLHTWHDKTRHKPYLLTDLSPYELDQLDRLKNHPGFDHIEPTKKFDPLRNESVTLTKVVAKDPLAIGGRPTGCMREIIPEEYAKHAESTQHGQREARVWEASIKYYQCYIYDNLFVPGMLYSIRNGQLQEREIDSAEANVKKITSLFREHDQQETDYAERWARLLEYPAPSFKRAAIDIEVYSPIATRVPDPREAPYQVICTSIVSTDKQDRVLLLKRKGVRDGVERLPADTKVELYDSEEELIKATFNVMREYPFIITFNGDDFDLRYLAQRAEHKLGIPRREIPIHVGRRVCLLENSIHIDLYKFFYNRSIQIYAFNNKYRDVTLDDVGKALIDLPKIEPGKPLPELSYFGLARYCLRDSEITFKLTAFNEELTMKLILVLARISKMPMEDVSRQGVSRWIRNFLHFEHRRLDRLIPSTSDILSLKGKAATKSTIKGKKFKGAIVVEPVPGVHFNVAVMDFPSLYPSIIKVWNLGYQTILCSHEECKDNIVPGTPHWVCRHDKAIESLLIGSLRDLRVKWYKPKSKDASLPADVQSWYSVIQRALKVILNASYGVFGADSFDLYCPPVAEATAAIGRHSIKQIVEKAEKLGIAVLYGDTDSVFLKNPTKTQISELAKWSETELKMGLDVDKIYRYAVFSSRKKNYLGVLEDGSVDVKGMTGKKKHIPKLIKEAFEAMKSRLAEVKSSAEFEEAKKDIKKIVQDRYLKLRRREWKHLTDLAFHVVLGAAPEQYKKTTPQHVRAARMLKETGAELKAGDLISFVKVTRPPHVKPVELARNNMIDVDKYVAYLQSTFEQVLDALGLEFEEIIGLTKLERFM